MGEKCSIFLTEISDFDKITAFALGIFPQGMNTTEFF